jgi:hypothetical protein
MEMSDIDVVIINLNNYLSKPFIRVITKHNLKELEGAKIHIIDNNNINEFIPKLKQARWVLDNNYIPSYLGDELRCYLATQYKNYLYLDADTFISRSYILKAANDPRELIIPGGYDNTFSTSLFFSKNYGENPIRKIYEAYESVTDVKDYYLCDGVFVSKKFSLEERLSIIDKYTLKPAYNEVHHIGYGKFLHYYHHILPNNPIIAYTNKTVDLSCPLLDKYKSIWVISNSVPYTYMKNIDDKRVIYQLNSGSFNIDDFKKYFMLDVIYHATSLKISPKFVDITDELTAISAN